MSRYPELAGKIVLVTGAASGIGRAQAKLFLAQGATVLGFDRQPMAQLPHFFPYQVDLRQVSALEKTVQAVLADFPRIDILVQTAGILDGYAPTLETDEELWRDVMETNVFSVYRLTNLLLPQMLARQSGILINMASIASLVAGGGGAAYTAAKHAIAGYTKQLAFDYAAQGIRANALAPGAVKTPMNAADFAGNGDMVKWVAAETPQKRWAEPEEIAEATLFLASDAASYMQGVLLPIDGGWTIK